MTPRCYCGFLDWTIREHGVLTHKHDCPARTDAFCQAHPGGCDSALDVPGAEAGWDGASTAAERSLREALDAARDVADLSRPGWPTEVWYGVRSREMRALIDALARLDANETEPAR